MPQQEELAHEAETAHPRRPSQACPVGIFAPIAWRYPRMRSDMNTRALQARAAGEHERAIACWRALLRDRPEDWQLALELKRDLKAALHYPESDPQFRRAARFLPDAEWLAHYTALYAYHGEDLDALDRRAREMLERTPDDHRLWAISAT